MYVFGQVSGHIFGHVPVDFVAEFLQAVFV